MQKMPKWNMDPNFCNAVTMGGCQISFHKKITLKTIFFLAYENKTFIAKQAAEILIIMQKMPKWNMDPNFCNAVTMGCVQSHFTRKWPDDERRSLARSAYELY